MKTTHRLFFAVLPAAFFFFLSIGEVIYSGPPEFAIFFATCGAILTTFNWLLFGDRSAKKATQQGAGKR